MNKYAFFIGILLLLMLPSVSAMNVTAGNETMIYTIEECEGPISIKVTSEEGIKDDELFIKDCTKVNNNKWDCYCDNGYDLIINTRNDTFNMFDFTIAYFVDFKNYVSDTGRVPSLDEIEYENEIRTKKIIDVFVQQPEKKKIPFELNIETKNAMIVGFLIALSIIVFIFMKGRTALDFNNKKENNDVLNYRTKKDDELDDIFNQIK